MLKISRHIAVVGWLFLGLFLVGNSGFAFVLHKCVAVQMDCCEKPNKDSKDACMDTPMPIGGPTFKAPFLCHTNTVVGGLTTKSGLLEKTPIQKETVSTFFMSANVALAPSTITSSSSLSYAINTSPPSVEKCVLNATFLI